MNQKKPIELREYQKKSVDEHEALMLEGDLDLQNELEAKKILTISIWMQKVANFINFKIKFYFPETEHIRKGAVALVDCQSEHVLEPKISDYSSDI